MSKRAPKPPDYAATAREQATASRNITEQQTWANRPDQRTPFGNTTWSNTPEWDESTQQNLNRWTQSTTLDPRSQGALDSQLDLQRGRSDIAGSMLGRVGNELGSTMDWNQFQQGGQAPNAPNLQTGVNQQNVSPEQLQRGLDFSGAQQIDPSQSYVQRAEGAINDRFSARNEPRFGREQANLETQLRNRGVKPGDEAYDRSLSDLRQGQNDAREQSQYQAIIGSGQEGSRMFGMDMSARQQQVGETGQQGAFANQASAGQFGMGSSASGQNFSQGLQGAAFGNQAQQAGFGNQMQASNYQSQLRQQQIAEEMQRRGFSLNEVNALLTGQQVGMPSMPSFNTANRGETPQLNQAAQNTYQAGLDSANSQNAFMGSLVGAAASPFSGMFGGGR